MRKLGLMPLLIAGMNCLASGNAHSKDIEYSRTDNWIITDSGSVCTAKRVDADSQRDSEQLDITIESSTDMAHNVTLRTLFDSQYFREDKLRGAYTNIAGQSAYYRFNYKILDGNRAIKSDKIGLYPVDEPSTQGIRLSDGGDITEFFSREESSIIVLQLEGEYENLRGRTDGIVEAADLVKECAQKQNEKKRPQEKEENEAVAFCMTLPIEFTSRCVMAPTRIQPLKVMSYRDFLLDEDKLLYAPIQVDGLVGRTEDGGYGIYDKNGGNGRVLNLERASRDDRGAVLDKCSNGCDAVVTGRPTPLGIFATKITVVD